MIQIAEGPREHVLEGALEAAHDVVARLRVLMDGVRDERMRQLHSAARRRR
jgi:hypothetical protein